MPEVDPLAEPPVARPRVEGDREREVLTAALEVLGDVGYDRLTMDAVAARARASKATLYRRWAGKAALVTEALAAAKGSAPAPDTGSLRGDLLAMYCGAGGLTDAGTVRRLGSVITAITTDPEFAAAFRAHVLADRLAAAAAVFERARERGDLREDVDLDVLVPALPGILLHRSHLLGEPTDTDVVARVVDQVILPSALAPHRSTRPTGHHADSPKG